MAAQSKLSSMILPPDRTLRSILAHLTTLYFRHRKRISRTVYLTLFVALLNRVRLAIAEQKAAADVRAAARSVDDSAKDKPAKRRKIELDRTFFKNLLRLLRICIPGWRSKEMRLLLTHSLCLVVRTLISLKVAAMDGKLVASLVRGKGMDFLWGLVKWMGIAVPATICNAMVSLQTLARIRYTGEDEQRKIGLTLHLVGVSSM